MRKIVFLSHANPEDNEFTLWLALQLTRQGYSVWCDLTGLIGGEDWWSNIEGLLRDRTVKFLYVLSHSSNHKDGVLKELSLAQNIARKQGLHDFVIPLKIDTLPHDEINIQLNRLNVIPFYKGWAAGLRQLGQKLSEEDVPHVGEGRASDVTRWWRAHSVTERSLIHQPEDVLSNWFEVQGLPKTVQFHHVLRYGGGPTRPLENPPFPVAKWGSFLISYATADELRPAVLEPDRLVDSISVPTSDFLSGDLDFIELHRREASKLLATLLRQSWEIEIEHRGLPAFKLSGGATCAYFRDGTATDNKVFFMGVRGTRTYRQVVGYSTMPGKPSAEATKRYWHFGLQLKALTYPVFGFAAKPHVLFSSDGDAIWWDHRRLHRARRSECRNWWNAEWRDRILATMSWLAGEDGWLRFSLGSGDSIVLPSWPISLQSPVSFVDPDREELTDVHFGTEDWEDNDDDMEES